MTNSKLIYIEDDQILGNLITQALVDYGFEIDFRTTLNGLQESLASMLPDLLILDIEVNNQSCLDILPAIRSQYPQLPIIIASSHTNGAKIIRSYDAGAKTAACDMENRHLSGRHTQTTARRNMGKRFE